MLKFLKYQILDSILLHTRLIDENKTNQYVNQLNTEDLNRLKEIKNIRRQQEFITTRLLLNKFYKNNSLLYYLNNKPFLKNKHFISISHKDQELIIGLNEFYQIGIDIEKIDFKIEKIKGKFCTTGEISKYNENQNIELLTKYWCAKEATFKCLDFQENIFLKDINVNIKSEHEGLSENNGTKYRLDFNTSKKDYIICHAQKEF